ncbi:hypothetical protein [Pandoraea anapnoica]|uniref:hypothetical protein n=1 Tax=Pandoraea anapnoica TaxID=2508301 RepID=UPI001582F9E7|nr:hypothetical protein [Pandoraea anapnoica]
MPHPLEAKIEALIDALAEHARSNFALVEGLAALTNAMVDGAEPEMREDVAPSYGGLAG